MRRIVRPGMMTVVALALAGAALTSHAQTPPATKGAVAPASPAARPANFSQVVATVNGEKITRGELVDFLNRYQIPPENEETIYRDAVDTLINMTLITQYLGRLNLTAPKEEVDRAIGDLEKQLKAENRSLAEALVESGKSMEEVRKEYANRLRWIAYVKQTATEGALQNFAKTHKDLLNGTQARASHILLRVEPLANAAEKEKVRQKLLGIKRDIEAKKLTFAQAANKYSEDPANSEGAGGDIGFFALNSGIVEEFGKAAFSLKTGQISDPIETPYGYHLILVTDRKEGKDVDFERNRPLILNAFAADLQKNILSAERKAAKVDIKPMPADLFPLPGSTSEPTAPKEKAAAQPK